MRKYDCYDEHNHVEQTDVGTCDHQHIERLLAEVEALREASKAVDRLRKRLPDPDFGEQQTTARAIGEVVRDALAKRGEEGK